MGTIVSNENGAYELRPGAMGHPKHFFTEKDFEGAGQYIVRSLDTNIPRERDGYLSTIMYKVGYMHPNNAVEKGKYNNYALISMADGYITDGYFDNHGYEYDTDKWEFKPFVSKQHLVNYLNHNPHNDNYRFATGDEVRRVVEYQKYRWANPLTPAETIVPTTFWGKLKFLFNIK